MRFSGIACPPFLPGQQPGQLESRGDGYLVLLSPRQPPSCRSWGQEQLPLFRGASSKELSLPCFWSLLGKEPGSSSTRKASAQLLARSFPGQLLLYLGALSQGDVRAACGTMDLESWCCRGAGGRGTAGCGQVKFSLHSRPFFFPDLFFRPADSSITQGDIKDSCHIDNFL